MRTLADVIAFYSSEEQPNGTAMLAALRELPEPARFLTLAEVDRLAAIEEAARALMKLPRWSYLAKAEQADALTAALRAALDREVP